MASGTLYTYEDSFRASKILIAAQYSGADIKLADFVFGETNKSNDFLKKFPTGKVPAFETSDNRPILESNAIAYYVGNEQLRGKTLLDQAYIQQWINFADSEILPAACTWVFPCLGIMQYNKQATMRAKEEIKKAFGILNQHLLTRTYLVGERITQADIAVCCTVLMLYQHVLDLNFRKPFTNVNRWFVTLINQPQFKTVLKEVQICKKMAQFDAKKYAEIQDKDKEKCKGKEEVQQKQKDAKNEEKKEPDNEPEDEMDIMPQQPKPKDPFEKFPTGTFNMDEFKRVYSNEAEKVSIEHFWNKFDKKNYSIWYAEYKYPEDLTLVFMSCNLISGMFQRLDRMRKNAFASVILFGEDNASTISGIWIWRGHELAFKLSDDWQVDYESYSWQKLDPDTEETKKLVNEYLAWSGDFGGKKFNQGKIFK